MHKDAKKIARRIDDAFAALRAQGFFAKATTRAVSPAGWRRSPKVDTTNMFFITCKMLNT
jgi:hypothetical protein